MWYRHCAICGAPIYMGADAWRNTIGQVVLCPACQDMEVTTTLLCLCPECGRMYEVEVIGEVDDHDVIEDLCPDCVVW